MHSTLLNFGFASLFMLALIVFTELLVSFKRPIVLKAMFLLITIVLMYRAAGEIYCSYNGYNRWLMDFPNSVIPAAALCFFSVLYQYKLRWYVITFGVVMVLTQLLILSYYSFIDPVDPSITLSKLPQIGNIIKALKVFFITGTLLITVYIFLKILKKYQQENLYFNQLKAWSIFILISITLHWIGNLLKYSTGSLSDIGQVMVLLGNFSALLIILFRPRFLNRTNLRISLGDFFTKKTNSELDEQLFIETFFTKTYYLNKEASLENLSKELNISSESINGFIYLKYGNGFNDLVNKHRISYFIDLVNTGNFNDYTIDALAQEAGFNSRHHLYKPFKKFHGGTPSDFVRSVSNN